MSMSLAKYRVNEPVYVFVWPEGHRTTKESVPKLVAGTVTACGQYHANPAVTNYTIAIKGLQDTYYAESCVFSSRFEAFDALLAETATPVVGHTTVVDADEAREMWNIMQVTTIWLDSALSCKGFVWDADQSTAALETLAAAREILSRPAIVLVNNKEK